METQTDPNWAVPYRTEPCRTVPYHAVEKRHKWAMSPSQGPWEELVWKYFKIQKNSNKIKNYSLFDRVYHNVNRSTLDLIWRIIKIDPFHPCSLFSLGYCMILSLMMNWRYVGQWLINTNLLVQNACTKWNIFVFMLVSCIGEKHWYCSILI